jgi:hypothetical protein
VHAGKGEPNASRASSTICSTKANVSLWLICVFYVWDLYAKTETYVSWQNRGAWRVLNLHAFGRLVLQLGSGKEK